MVFVLWLKNVEAFLNIAPPTTRKELRRFIGLINYYCNMWIHCSDTLAPLTALTSRNVPWRWTEVEQKAFDAMKRIINRKTLSSYPDFTAPFDIHTDASDLQLGAVILQRGKPIAFYSRKLNSAQQRYTVGERKLLSVVETLKMFRNILLGQPLNVYTDHLNLTYKTCTTDRVLRWRLLLEEYNSTFYFISGECNIVADALSRLPCISSSIKNEQSYTLQILAECFGTDANDLPSTVSPFAMFLLPKLNMLILLFSVNWTSLMLLFIGRLFVEAVNPMINLSQQPNCHSSRSTCTGNRMVSSISTTPWCQSHRRNHMTTSMVVENA